MTYSVKDFHTKSRNEKSTKMPLLFDKEDTGMFLMVKGIEARSVAQARLSSQLEYAAMIEDAESMTDDKDRKRFESDGAEAIKIELAAVLVDGWSFDEKFSHGEAVILLQENAGLADAVIAHASTAANYFAKK